MPTLPKNYDPKTAEKKWQDEWFAKKTYAWDAKASRADTYVIDTPPPTVSGLLHMGHIYSYTQADFIARFQRMTGKSVFYPMGFDDNGLPTERLVEKVKKIRATDMPREQFIAICQEVVKEAEQEFRDLFKSVALSVDWDQEYQTISEHTRKISQMSFLDLHRKGHVYRADEPMLWDPVDQTALAQADIEDKELPSHFNDIIFGIDGSDEKITIGTTRPELLPACVAVFYHPDDDRYKHLKGKQAVTPLFGVKVPILEDDAVEIDKGTGIMMCCTFGDEKDILKWRKHKLEMRVILNKYGKIDVKNAEEFGAKFVEAITPLQNLKVSNTDPKSPGARQKIIEMLREAGLLTESKPIVHSVKCAERSGAPLEILPTAQWFVKVLDKKEMLKKKVNESTWRPDFMRLRAEQWIDGLSWDWCISRQRYFGVPFPVWYSKRPSEEGKVLVAAPNKLPVNPLVDLPEGYSKDEVVPDIDVMDTWATSSVSPQISSHAITDEFAIDASRHKQLFPADVRPQAHEIIRTWAFYTIVKAVLHENSVPWHNLMISGWCLAADKTKMSKSKGNVVTPVELIRDKGADAVRYWASTSRLGMDTAFSEDLLKIGKKLVTKLWNATSFAALHLEKIKDKPGTAAEDVAKGRITEALDLWILTRLQRAVEKSTKEFEAYEYADARTAIEDFFWNDFCDNYLELVKARAYGEGDVTPQAQLSAAYTLHHCLDAILRLFAPFVPHVTEELFSHLFADAYQASGSVHARGMWPKANAYPLDEKAEQSGIACVEVLNAIRKLKSEKNVSIKYPLTRVTLAAGANKGDWERLQHVLFDLKSAGNVQEMDWGNASGTETEGGQYVLTAEFAPEADAA